MDYIQQCYNFATNGVPSYVDAYHNIRWGLDYCLENCTETGSYSPVEFFMVSLPKYGKFDAENDFMVIGGLAVVWTLLRYIMASVVFTVSTENSNSLDP